MSDQTPNPPVHELKQEIDRLKERVESLEDRLDKQPQATHDGLDSRDAAVLEHIEHGQEVTTRHLQQLYRDETDIKQESTLRKRIRDLTAQDFFKKTATTRWVYRGN